ncbi:outer membrane beta-barrel protein [Variovorax sp. J31P179]|uniref:outer membrane protein n=1 Tax=Variovorax sp. J31P179 TaxID=3053508 RepID=UPI0025787966|nr:outer membrane beta-barrel protein [Variovorax sp. J31P179]
MKIKMTLSAISAICGILAAPVAIATPNEELGWYGSIKAAQTSQRVSDMEDSLRPAGAVLPQETRQEFVNGSLGMGYQFGAGWRAEVEYTLPQKQEYTSDVAGRFRGSLNHHEVDAERMMANAYYDLPVKEDIAVFASAGLGWAKVKSSGWQGNVARQFESKTVNNLAYSVGAGVTYSPVKKISLDVGYRYVDMGRIESGLNNFANARGLRDEKMKAKLVSHEIYIGGRYRF